MVKMEWSQDKLELTKLFWDSRGSKKVGILRRKTGGKVYESPRIVLNRKYEDFIGKRYGAYRGRAVITHQGYGSVEPTTQEGDCIVLFFSDRWNKPKIDEKD